MDIAEKIATEIDAIPGQPTSYEVARVAIEAYQREMWTPHFDLSRKFNLLPELRRNRASSLTAHIMHLIGKYICEHDAEHDLHRRASGDLFEAIYESGCDIITDADRRAAGLPDRGPYGMTKDEMQILEAKRTEAMLRPTPPMILAAHG
jgi:hypothetical protein